jgi:hypothetical protein
MTSMQRKQGRKAIHSWKGAGRLLEQWREDLRRSNSSSRGLRNPHRQKRSAGRMSCFHFLCLAPHAAILKWKENVVAVTYNSVPRHHPCFSAPRTFQVPEGIYVRPSAASLIF